MTTTPHAGGPEPERQPSLNEMLSRKLTDGIDPEALSVEERIQLALIFDLRASHDESWRTRVALSEVRDTVREERIGRRTSIRLAITAGAVVIVVLAGIAVRWRFEDDRYSRVTCEQRTERTQQIRDAINVGATAAAIELGAPEDERDRVIAVIDTAVRGELPPPDC